MTDLPGTISWFKRVPLGRVDAYRILGWVAESVAPSHHDVHCVLMRYGRPVAADAEPPIPIGRPRVVRKIVRIRPAPQFRVAREVSPAERVCAASGRLSQGCGSSVGLPIPGQQFVEVLGRVIGQPSEHVGQPSLGIDIVEFGSLN